MQVILLQKNGWYVCAIPSDLPEFDAIWDLIAPDRWYAGNGDTFSECVAAADAECDRQADMIQQTS